MEDKCYRRYARAAAEAAARAGCFDLSLARLVDFEHEAPRR